MKYTIYRKEGIYIMAYTGQRLDFARHYVRCYNITIPNNVIVGNSDWSRKFDWMENLDKVNIGGGGTRSSN